MRSALRGVWLLLAAIASNSAFAVCACGPDDGLFTLATISIDGDLGDWAAVHADPDNNTCDGPVNGLIDLDAPVQSTGRDLTHFALTWDQSAVYLFTERVGSANNVQRFVYYADIDNDGLMETGEPVIGAAWRGNNRRVDVYLFDYVAAAPGGDPMLPPASSTDGYTLPGSFANVPNSPNRSGQWGSTDGTQMELSVSWTELGIAPGSAFTFHVSSSNSSLASANFAAQIDDNLSGCGGGLGSTRQPAVLFTPDRALITVAGAAAVASHLLQNVGNSADLYTFSSTLAGAHSPDIRYYFDNDDSATLTPGDTLLTDSDGDGLIDSGPIPAGGQTALLIVYQTEITATGVTTVATTASSTIRPSVSDQVADRIEIVPEPVLNVTKTVVSVSDPANGSVNPLAIPGAVMRYTIRLANEGNGVSDPDSIVITDAIPPNGALKVDDAVAPGSGPVRFVDGTPPSNLTYRYGGLADLTDDVEFSADGGTSFDYVPSVDANGCDTAVTHIRIRPSGTIAPLQSSGAPSAEFSFRYLLF